MTMMVLLLNHRIFKDRNKIILIRALFLFNILLLLAGQSSAECEGHRIGDKWFDGCRWCLCQGDLIVCTICSVEELPFQPCKNIGAIWYDGGYQCICRPDGIHCRIGSTFAALLSSDEFEWREELHCSGFDSQQCICGLDGVPSCSTQVIDRSKMNIRTIYLYPRFEAPTGFEHVKVSEQKARRSLQSLLLEKLNAKTKDSNNYKHVQNLDLKNNGVKDKIKRDNSIQRSTSSIIAVTSNRCSQGSRWYGGSLRCYCDVTDRSITCGDPSIVASRIDGIRLQSKHCVEGTSWEEETSCRHCSCLVDGVVYCNRSSLCPLPRLINPFHDVVDIDEETGEMTGGEVELWSDWTPEVKDDVDSADWKIPVHTNASSDTTTSVLNLISRTITTTQKTIKTTQVYSNNTDRRNNGSSKEKTNASTLVIIRECLPGTMKIKKCQNCTCDINGRFQCENSTCGKKATVQSSTLSTSKLKVTSPVTQTSSPDVKSTPAQTSSPDVTSPVSQTSSPDITNPVSQTSSPDVTSPVSKPTLSTNHYYSRLFKTLRPYTVIPGNRDYAITYKPQDTSCGDFKLNDLYWVDCNLCECTIVGPKCTAKNCVSKRT